MSFSYGLGNRDRHHPERQPGEVWCCNIPPEKFDDHLYQTKRIGKKAYDKDDRIVKSAVPLFVSIAEFIEFGVTLTDDGWKRVARSDTEAETIRRILADAGIA